MPAKPAPKPTRIVCDACGMNWEAHGAKPTLETCVGLLKAELAKRPKPYQTWLSSGNVPATFTGGQG